MKRAWKIVLIFALGLFVLGGVCFALSLILGADLVRIADGVFAHYDLTQTILNVQALTHRVFGIFGL